MKIIFIAVLVILAIFIIIQSLSIMSTGKAERQKYTVIQSGSGFEIRFYPEAIFATIRSDAKTYAELSSPGFRRLAGYIFGGNESGSKIAMTSPVQMDINDTLSEMSFVMPSEYKTDQLPKPVDSEIVIHKSKDEYVAAVTFGGFASDKMINDYSGKLREILTKNGIVWYGNFRFLGYNPPFQLVNRRNEIIVSVRWPY